MAKKEDLKKIVRGKGLEALRPTAEDSSTNSDEYSQQKIPQTVTTHKAGEQMEQEEKNKKQYIITEISPSPEQQTYVKEKLGENNNQFLIWDIFILQGEQRDSVFKRDVPLNFNLCCATSGLFAQLKPELEIQWNTSDIQRLQLQPLYNFKIKIKPPLPIFKISYEIRPVLAGFFTFNVIVDVKQTDLFWVKEGFVFKITN